MARGGKREGAGRKQGQATRLNEEARRKAAEGGITPLDYMLNVLRDEQADLQRRDDMAKAAAPYLHAKLASIEHHGSEDEAPIRHRVEQVIIDPKG